MQLGARLACNSRYRAVQAAIRICADAAHFCHVQGIQQIQAVAWLLQQAQDGNSSNSGSKLSSRFHEECSWMMDQVVLRHLDVCFGVHQAVVLACVVYVTAKVTQTALPFSTITQVRTAGLLLCDCKVVSAGRWAVCVARECSATVPCFQYLPAVGIVLTCCRRFPPATTLHHHISSPAQSWQLGPCNAATCAHSTTAGAHTVFCAEAAACPRFRWLQ